MIAADVREEVAEAVELAQGCALDLELVARLQRELSAAVGHDDGAVRLSDHWRFEPRLRPDLRAGQQVSPADLVDIAGQCRRERRWVPLMVAANAWGYGPAAFGHWRTQRITALPEAGLLLQAAVAVLDAHGPVAAYAYLHDEGHVHGWGPALFTRFLRFADVTGSAVVIDHATAAGVNALQDDVELGAGEWSTAEYAFHHALLHRLQLQQGVPTAQAERWLTASARRLRAGQQTRE